MIYNITRWFWFVGDDATQVYSSQAKAYLPVSDARYVAWAEAGNYATRIVSEDELKDVFAAHYPEGWHETPRYVPVYVARERLEAVGLWADAAAAIASDPAMLLKVATLKDGLDVNDAVVIGLLTAIGADPAVILA